MSGLVLGSVTLDGLEIPGGLRFGGQQALAVHRLAGGGRVVDVLGPDDADVTWSGIISGPTAAARAQTLDAMRSAGGALPLMWDGFFYTVVIRRLALSFANPWWIPYVIGCTVVADPAQTPTVNDLGGATAILGDLAEAAGFAGVQAAVAAVGQPGALTAGTAAYAGAATSVNAASQGLGAQIAAAESALSGGELSSVVSAAGSLATATMAQGYVQRAAANLALSAG